MDSLKTIDDFNSAIEQFKKYTGTKVQLMWIDKDGPHDYYNFVVVMPNNEVTNINGYFHCDSRPSDAMKYGLLYAKLVNSYFSHVLWFLNVINLEVRAEPKVKPKIKLTPLRRHVVKKNEKDY